MTCYEFEGVRPVVHGTAYVHPTAALIGDVIVEAGCFIGPGASLRGDLGRILVREGANVQDNCTVHCFPGKGVIIEPNGHVGHGTVLHGCHVQRDALIGMNAVIMDDAVVGEEVFIAAMSFVKAGTVIPSRHLAAGVPAKIIRELSAEEISWKRDGTAVYQHLARRYLATAREVLPLREGEACRPTLPPLDYKPKHEQ